MEEEADANASAQPPEEPNGRISESSGNNEVVYPVVTTPLEILVPFSSDVLESANMSKPLGKGKRF